MHQTIIELLKQRIADLLSNYSILLSNQERGTIQRLIVIYSFLNRKDSTELSTTIKGFVDVSWKSQLEISKKKITTRI
jgi:hypothetical protein